MRKTIPPITEDVATLKARLQQHDGHTKPRLHMLYLLASRQAAVARATLGTQERIC